MKIPWHKVDLVVKKNGKNDAHCNCCNGRFAMIQPIYMAIHQRKKKVLARFCSNDCVLKFKAEDRDV